MTAAEPAELRVERNEHGRSRVEHGTDATVWASTPQRPAWTCPPRRCEPGDPTGVLTDPRIGWVIILDSNSEEEENGGEDTVDPFRWQGTYEVLKVHPENRLNMSDPHHALALWGGLMRYHKVVCFFAIGP